LCIRWAVKVSRSVGQANAEIDCVQETEEARQKLDEAEAELLTDMVINDGEVVANDTALWCGEHLQRAMWR
jgi:hypothetical protein